MLILYRPRRVVRTLEVQIGAKLVHFKLRNHASTGEAVMVAEVIDSETLQAIRHLGAGYRIVQEEDADLVGQVASPRAKGEEEEQGEGLQQGYPPIVRAAFRNGWKYGDLTGSGDDNVWGEEGGRAPQTGLTMAEMSISVPPEGWEEKNQTHYPWEILGWRPPGEGWIAPKLVSKRPSAVRVPTLDEAPRDGQHVNPDEDALGEGASAGGEGSEGAPDAGSVDQVDPPPARGKKKPETRNEEALAGWSVEQVGLAKSTLAEQWALAGKAPTPSKARHHLKKVDIVASAEQVEALLDLVQVDLTPL